MKTIAIANQKGGTGKTTTAYNLGIALTQQGYRVLMVDFDPQGNLSCYCGIPPEQDLDQTLTELLMKVAGEKPLYHRECVYRSKRVDDGAPQVDFRLKKGRGDEFTKELWIDHREDSKSLAWSSVILAYHNIDKIGEVVGGPKALGDIRGVSYIYGIFYRFGLIDVPEKVKEKMKK